VSPFREEIMTDSSLLVFSAHAADFCSRAGGLIALTAGAGAQVHVVDLSFGERGESEDYWALGSGTSVEGAKAARETEAREAADRLGASIEFLDWGDYPLEIDRERLDRLAGILRLHRPSVVVTHWNADPYNVDHQVTADAVARAITMAGVPGFDPSSPKLHPPALYAFEPTVPRNEDTGFRPNQYVVIDDVFEQKMDALSRLKSQKKLVQMYTQWGEYRAAQARQWSGQPVRYAEAYFRHSAEVSRGYFTK
jgi:4-oxalomesaconate hydratase